MSQREYTGTSLSANTLQNGADYTYDNATGRMTAVKLTSPLGANTVSVVYGSLASGKIPTNVYTSKWNGSTLQTYTYDKLGRPAKVNTKTSGDVTITGQYTYEDLGSGKTSSRVVGYSVNSYAMTYGYDANGNITSHMDGIYDYSYSYDSLGRLVRENNLKANRTYVYEYSNGNITARKSYPYTTGSLGTEYTAERQEYVYGKTTQIRDRVTSFNGKTITYATGLDTMTGYDGYTLSWFRQGLLSSYSKTGDSHTFTYDMDGRRLSKTDNGTTTNFVYAGNLLVGQTTGSNTLAFLLAADGSYVGFTYNGTNYYYVRNVQGDVIQIVNAAGTTVVKYYYDAWGKLIATEGSLASTIGAANPIRYRSYYYDTGTGLYYLQSRYYNPELRRFISADKILDAKDFDGYNRYAYCGNNPVCRLDVSGNAWDWCTFLRGAVVAAIGVATIAAVVAAPVCAPELAILGYYAMGAAAVIFGASDINESINGYNPVKEEIFGGDDLSYGMVEGFVAFECVQGITELSTAVCFVGGTEITTSEGLISIEEIQVGMLVLASDPIAGENGEKEVLRVFENETDELIHINISGETISCTTEHPFFHATKGWTAAYKLKAGDILVSVNGEYVTVEQIQHEILETPVKVYNFEVADYHTYYVGDNGILVHNRCILDKEGVNVEVRSREHGVPHAHVSGNGPNTTVGLNGSPLPHHKPFSTKQARIIKEYWDEIENGIRTYFRFKH